MSFFNALVIMHLANVGSRTLDLILTKDML